MNYPNSTLSFYKTRKAISSSVVLNDEQKREFTAAFDHIKCSWLEDIETFISKDKDNFETTIEHSDESSSSIPDSFDPSLKLAELEVKSQSQSSGGGDEISAFKTFGITKYLQCESMIHNI